jgi:hypothetical protein
MAQLAQAEQAFPRLYFLHKPEPGRRPIQGSLLDRILEPTGRAQLQAVVKAEAPASAWMKDLWKAAAGSRSETARGMMPERLLDQALAHPESLQDRDLEFLIHKAVAGEAATWEATSSIRILATLLEDQVIERQPALEALMDALYLHEPERRLAAIEGLWQADATEALDVLEGTLRTETLQSIRETIEHVVKILRGLGAGNP